MYDHYLHYCHKPLYLCSLPLECGNANVAWDFVLPWWCAIVWGYVRSHSTCAARMLVSYHSRRCIPEAFPDQIKIQICASMQLTFSWKIFKNIDIQYSKTCACSCVKNPSFKKRSQLAGSFNFKINQFKPSTHVFMRIRGNIPVGISDKYFNFCFLVFEFFCFLAVS